MQKFLRTLRRYQAKGPLLLFLVVVSTVAVYYVLSQQQTATLIKYAIYFLSSYTLCCLVFFIIEQYRILIRKALQVPYVHRYFHDFEWRTFINTYVSLAISLAFAALKLTFSFQLSSLWFAAIAIYYIVLSVTRYIILSNNRKISGIEEQEERRLRQLGTYRASGYMLFFLTAALLGAVWQMVFFAKSYTYPGHLIYAVAAFAFYSVITAGLNLFRVQALDNPIVSAARLINFASALVSMLTLQTAMFSVFGSADTKILSQYLNAILGTLICFGVFALAVIAVIRAGNEIKKIKYHI
ncbi:MAG TPA: hypothetical protein PKA81_13160 [Clostridia bacterium]|nr:hypothetical protein [Clostridia bacterium]